MQRLEMSNVRDEKAKTKCGGNLGDVRDVRTPYNIHMAISHRAKVMAIGYNIARTVEHHDKPGT